MNRFLILLAIMGFGLALLLVNDSTNGALGFDNDRFGSLLYLGVLGTAIGSGILLSRRHFGDTVRNLALWALVILAIMAGYEYRYELQDIGSRLSGGLIPGSPLSVTDAEGRAIVTLAKRPDGHFGARVMIDGHGINALVDTGATTTVLSFADAVRAGFEPASLRFSIEVSTANGTASAARVVAQDISIGAISRRNLPLLVAEEGRLGESLLGMNFIGTLSGFDLRGDRLILRD